MSMFFVVQCNGKFDKKDHLWDDGITLFQEPDHMTKREVLEFIDILKADMPNLDKSTCPDVQELQCREPDTGMRLVILLVKAKGYQQAAEKARKFCDIWYKPKKTPRKKQFTAKELLNAIPKGIRQASQGQYDFPYYSKRLNWR